MSEEEGVSRAALSLTVLLLTKESKELMMVRSQLVEMWMREVLLRRLSALSVVRKATKAMHATKMRRDASVVARRVTLSPTASIPMLCASIVMKRVTLVHSARNLRSPRLVGRCLL
jgi:hypothetical protein